MFTVESIYLHGLVLDFNAAYTIRESCPSYLFGIFYCCSEFSRKIFLRLASVAENTVGNQMTVGALLCHVVIH